MNVIGVIAEYNPFHLGHLYQIKKIKELYPDSLIITVVSTCFTQRGNISFLNKWDKASICLDNGIDLVLELPTLYATQSADLFALGAVQILHKFKIDTLVFGSETDDVELLTRLAKTQVNNKTYDNLVKTYIDEGINYPTAMSRALKEITGITVDKPNDLLALSYIKEIIKNKYNITPLSIKRTNDYHDEEIRSNIINARLIRKLFTSGEDISNYVPSGVMECMYRNVSQESILPFLRYRIYNDRNNLNSYLTVDEGIENRLIKYIDQANSIEELTEKIKTKRYTYNKINRMYAHLILGLKKEDNNQEIYLRLLGFTKNGQKYLNTIKKTINEEIYTNYKPKKSKTLDLEYKATCIYSLLVGDKSLISSEFKKKPIIK